ncbi:hypothetical protein C9424_20675 [Arthrobacter sp. H-02-3]|nr:hypothetical protein C9424_20675 [Arthrobacter sp. H-02-3]
MGFFAAGERAEGVAVEDRLTGILWVVTPNRELDLNALGLGAWKHGGHDATSLVVISEACGAGQGRSNI